MTERDAAGGAATLAVDYVYDVYNRRIARTVDEDGAGTDHGATTEHFIYDGTDVVLDFVDADGPGTAESPELARRYLWGPAVDQLLAEETVDDGGAEDVLWPLADHLGTTNHLARRVPLAPPVPLWPATRFRPPGNRAVGDFLSDSRRRSLAGETGHGRACTPNTRAYPACHPFLP